MAAIAVSAARDAPSVDFQHEPKAHRRNHACVKSFCTILTATRPFAERIRIAQERPVPDTSSGCAVIALTMRRQGACPFRRQRIRCRKLRKGAGLCLKRHGKVRRRASIHAPRKFCLDIRELGKRFGDGALHGMTWSS